MYRKVGLNQSAKSQRPINTSASASRHLSAYAPTTLPAEGDEYYGHPHIFCHFEYKRQPYERLAFCERRELAHGPEWFSELEDHDRVRLTSEKFGTAWVWRPSS